MITKRDYENKVFCFRGDFNHLLRAKRRAKNSTTAQDLINEV